MGWDMLRTVLQTSWTKANEKILNSVNFFKFYSLHELAYTRQLSIKSTVQAWSIISIFQSVFCICVDLLLTFSLPCFFIFKMLYCFLVRYIETCLMWISSCYPIKSSYLITSDKYFYQKKNKKKIFKLWIEHWNLCNILNWSRQILLSFYRVLLVSLCRMEANEIRTLNRCAKDIKISLLVSSSVLQRLESRGMLTRHDRDYLTVNL